MTEHAPQHEHILVTGATGKTGGELVKLLLDRRQPFRVATRRPGALAPSLPAFVEVAELDFERPETFGPALNGAGRLFLIARPGDNHSDEVASPLIAAAKRAGVHFVVSVTAMGVEQDESFMLRKLERIVEDSGMSYAHLRPNWFMQNFSSGPMLAGIRKTGTLQLPAGDARLSFVDVRDVAAAAFTLLTHPDAAHGAYTLTGGEALSHADVMEKISRAAGRTIAYKAISEAAARSALAAGGVPGELIDRWTEFYRKIREGFCAPVTRDVPLLLGRAPISFDRYAMEHAAAWV